MSVMQIRAAKTADLASITRIYNHYIRNTIVSFEEEEVSESEMLQRYAVITKHHPFLVCEVNDEVMGYAYASSWKSRKAYENSVETTVYLSHQATGKGMGTVLMQEMLSLLQTQNFHMAMAGIALPNAGSIRLHEKLGFKKVAHFHEVGFKFNQWIDVAYWQKKL